MVKAQTLPIRKRHIVILNLGIEACSFGSGLLLLFFYMLMSILVWNCQEADKVRSIKLLLNNYKPDLAVIMETHVSGKPKVLFTSLVLPVHLELKCVVIRVVFGCSGARIGLQMLFLIIFSLFTLILMSTHRKFCFTAVYGSMSSIVRKGL